MRDIQIQLKVYLPSNESTLNFSGQIRQHNRIYQIRRHVLPFFIIKGSFHVTNYSPDGDTIRFQPNDLDSLMVLNGVPAKINRRGHVSLRLEGIDTLETHFSGLKQPPPLADDATDFLLERAGISNVIWAKERRSIRSADDAVPGYIFSRGTDKYGRVIALAAAGGHPNADGSEIFIDGEGLSQTLNYQLAESGMAYVTFYSGLFSDLRDALAEIAAKARSNDLGVYSLDKTNSGFKAKTLEDITDEIVMLPKLFRRLSAYIEETGTVRGFKAALEASREPVLDLRSLNITHFDTFVDEDADGSIKLTRLPQELVFDPMPQRLATDFKAMLSASANEVSFATSENLKKQSSSEAAAFSRRVENLRKIAKQT